MEELSVGGVLGGGIKTGLKNAPSLVGALLLWILTVWIPYLNVGTTIGLTGIIAAMSRGQVVSPTEIFNRNYRKQMGEFFLVNAFMLMGVYAGLIFMIIPGLVIAIAWGLAPLLVVDKGLNPTEAIQTSNDLTYGKKWTIFGGMFVLAIISMPVIGVLVYVGLQIHEVLGAILALVGYIVYFAMLVGAQAYVYGTLTANIPSRLGGSAAAA